MRVKLRNLLLTLLASSSLVACEQASTVVEVDLPGINFADGFQQSDADAIIGECDAENFELTVQPSGEITLVPGRNADYEAAACVLNFIKESGTTKFGFVGNEKYVTSEEVQ